MSVNAENNNLNTIKIFLDQTLDLTVASLKSRYRETIAGFCWVLINPLAMFMVQCYVFKIILKIQVEDYFVFLVSGLLPWIFITQSLTMCTGIFEAQGKLIKSFQINPLVLLFAQLFDNLFNFVLSFSIMLIVILALQPGELLGLLFLPIGITVFFIGVFGCAWLAATVQIFYRDTSHVVQFLVGLLFFITPIFYPIEFVPEKYRWVVHINPVYNIIRPVRDCAYKWDIYTYLVSLGEGALWSFSILGLAYWYWNKKKMDFYFRI